MCAFDEGHYSMGQKIDNEIGDMLMPSKALIYGWEGGRKREQD